jgi:hypothetical protein
MPSVAAVFTLPSTAVALPSVDAVSTARQQHPSHLDHCRVSSHVIRKRRAFSATGAASAAKNVGDGSGADAAASAIVNFYCEDQHYVSKLRRSARFAATTTPVFCQFQSTPGSTRQAFRRRNLTSQRTWCTHHWQLHASTESAESLAFRWRAFFSAILQHDHSRYWSVIPGEVEQFSARDFLHSSRCATFYPFHRMLLSDTELELRAR